jgi:hypothetical protein
VKETFDLLQNFSFHRKTSIGSRKPTKKPPRNPVDRLAVAVVEELLTHSRSNSTVPMVDIVELSMQRPRPAHDSLTTLFLTNPSTPTALGGDSEPLITPRSLALQILDRRALCVTPPLSPHTVIAKQRSFLRQQQSPVSFSHNEAPRPLRKASSFHLPPPVQRRACSDGPRVASHRQREAAKSSGAIHDLLDLCSEASSNSAGSSNKSNTGGWLSPTVSKTVSPIVDLFMPAMNLYAGLQ